VSELSAAETTSTRKRRLSLQPLNHRRISHSTSASLDVCHRHRRRVSVCVQAPSPLTISTATAADAAAVDDDDDDADDDCAAELLSVIHNCHREISQMLATVSRLEVRSTDMEELTYMRT